MQPKEPGPAEQHDLVHRELTGAVLKAFYKTYNLLGYGFLESVYKNALLLQLRSVGLSVDVEALRIVKYLGQPVGRFKIDLFVEEKLALELKATAVLGPTDKRQLLNFMRAGDVDVGLLLHYGPEPKFHRLVHPKFTL